MNGFSHPSIDALEAILGHAFREPGLLVEAVSHASLADAESGRPINERLEFLGDRVLGLMAAEALIEAFPHDREGLLARKLNALVRRERCAAIARDMSLESFIRLSEAEMRAGGALKPAILADACEAVLGALYLDGGIEAAQRIFRRFWGPFIRELTDAPADAKSALQEWLQAFGTELPHYRETGREGPDHQPRFRVEVSLPDGRKAEGEGSSRRAAEQDAAENLLVSLGLRARDHATGRTALKGET